MTIGYYTREDIEGDQKEGERRTEVVKSRMTANMMRYMKALLMHVCGGTQGILSPTYYFRGIDATNVL